MKKKIWFYICIIQTIILVIIISIPHWQIWGSPKYKESDLSEYLTEFVQENKYIPDDGYIPDAKTAKIIGSRIIDNWTGNNRFNINAVYIEYDNINRLWKIQKNYLFRSPVGGYVIIEQDSGKIVAVFLMKI